MSRRDDIYKDITECLNNIRNIQNGTNRLNEEEEHGDNANAVPYTNQDELFKSSLQPCKSQFGADFSKLKNPLLYYKEDGDVTLSGVIPSLNNAKFQYRLLDGSGNGCFLWLDSIQLTDDVINRINKIYGVYKNWKQQLTTSEDIKPISLKNEQ